MKTLQEQLLELEVKVAEGRHDHLAILAEAMQEDWNSIHEDEKGKVRLDRVNVTKIHRIAASGSVLADEVLKRGMPKQQEAWTLFFTNSCHAALCHTPMTSGSLQEKKEQLTNLVEGTAIVADLMLVEWKKRYG